MGIRNAPLGGIRILDLTSLYPGPLATMMLADLGAEVIRIEHPSRPDRVHFLPPLIGDESAAYLSLNRSKKSLALDVGKDESRQVFFDLVRTADLVFEQFRPGVLDRLGIGYEEAAKHNPGIIYLSLTGFGQDGPYHLRAGHDINYISWTGLLSEVRNEDRPVLPAFQIGDTAAGCYMSVIACLAALWYRERSGKGQQVDVSMVDAVLPMLTLQLAQYWGSSQESPAINPLDGKLACYGIYECADGKYVSLGALEPKFWENFCRALNKEEWISGNFATGKEGARVREEVAVEFKARTRDEWLRLAEAHDICLSPVNELRDLEEDPHLREREMIIEIEHKKGHKLKAIGIPIKFSDSRPGPPRPAPPTGRDSIQILTSIGYSEERIKELIRKGIVYVRDHE